MLAISSTIAIKGCGDTSGETTDPINVNVPMAYVERPLYVTNEDGELVPITMNMESPRSFNGGAKLILRERISGNTDAIDISSAAFSFGDYDVKDLSPSFDGTKLVFAMRAPQLANTDEDDQPTWNIWEYNLETKSLRRVIDNGIVAEIGHDIDPAYLPDGRIVFSSTRQKGVREILTDESAIHNKSSFSGLTDSRNEVDEGNEGIGEAFNLHVVDAEPDQSGTQTIKQITFNQSHDLQPTVLDTGEIAFLRWDNAEGNDQQSLYRINPDGSDLSFLYGYHSQNEITMTSGSRNATFYELTTLPNGKLMALLKLRNSSPEEIDGSTTPFLGGTLISINYKQFTELDQPLPNTNPSGSGQEYLWPSSVDLSNNISRNGYFNSAFPFNDGSNRILVSRTPCRLNNASNTAIISCNNINDAGVTEGDPYYGIWIYNPNDDDTFDPIINPAEGRMYSDVVILNDVESPPIKLSSISETASQGATGTLHIKSIYDFGGVLAETPDGASLSELADPTNAAFGNREARFLRVIKAVSMPDDEVYDYDEGLAFGISNNRNMREILGYVPIEPDGSVMVEVPANVAFQFDVVDRNARRIQAFDIHSNWLTLTPGEERTCNGCHIPGDETPHGRSDADPASINAGAPTATLPFPNTNPNYFSDEAGLTMAEVYALREEVRTLTPQVLYTDEWSDDTILGVTKEEDIELRYAAPGPDDVSSVVSLLPTTPANLSIPTNLSCIVSWSSSCRIIINYPDHIQPIWDEPRLGESDYACTSCHTDASNTRIPDGQLELTTETNNDGEFISYRELLQNDTVEIVNNLGYRFRTDGNGVPLLLTEIVTNNNGTPADPTDDFDEEVNVLDKDGNTINLIDPVANVDIPQTPDVRIQSTDDDGNYLFVVLDDNGTPDNTADDTYALDNGNQIPVTEPFTGTVGDNINQRLVLNNAANSRFFAVMTDASDPSNSEFNHTRLNQVDDVLDDTDDAPLINEHELRLISEWLDIGAQYYNNPFDAPAD